MLRPSRSCLLRAAKIAKPRFNSPAHLKSAKKFLFSGKLAYHCSRKTN
jgi:hypothetical protein